MPFLPLCGLPTLTLQQNIANDDDDGDADNDDSTGFTFLFNCFLRQDGQELSRESSRNVHESNILPEF